MNTFTTTPRFLSTFVARRARSAALLLALGGIAGCAVATDGEPLGAGDEAEEALLASEAQAAPEAQAEATVLQRALGAEARAEQQAAQGEGEAEFAKRMELASAASRKLAQLAAGALREPAMRGALLKATQASAVKEGKVFLRAHLLGSGKSMLAHMARSADQDPSAILQLLDQAGPMEIYLPVKAHRAAWQGDENVIVATQIDEHYPIYGFDLAGEEVKLSREAPPEVPVVSIVPAESFYEDGRPLGRDSAAGSSNLLAPSALWTGLWINEVRVGGDYENWARGEPEYEMYLQNSNSRGNIVCAEGQSSVEPYRWDMNGGSYSAPFLIASDADMPANVPMVIALYEDDDTRCVIKTDKDYLKLTTDLLMNSASAYKAIASKQYLSGQFVVQLFNAYVAAASIIRGNDEYVGTSTGLGSVGSSPVTMSLRNHNGTPTGSIVVQRKTDVAH